MENPREGKKNLNNTITAINSLHLTFVGIYCALRTSTMLLLRLGMVGVLNTSTQTDIPN